MTKEQKRMDKVLDAIFNEIMEYLFDEFQPKCPLENEVLWDVVNHQKWSDNSMYLHFLRVLGIQYVVAKHAGEYTEFYWLQKDFTCIFVTNNAM